MQTQNFKRTKYSCYFAYLAMSSIFSLPPLLFMTFRETYGISYTLLGTLVLANFVTQLTIDLIFTFFSKYFKLKYVIRVMPLLTTAGLVIYAAVPSLFPQYAYAGLLLGTVIFSVSAGLSEVLLSPVVAAIPSETPERDMSMLHSLYAWGVLFVVSVSTVFLKVFGTENWMYLTLILAILPVISCVFFCLSPFPEMDLTHAPETGAAKKRNFGLALCVVCIFLGSAAENVMTNWISVYMESALQIPKAVGDVLGLALFAVLLGFGRTLYAKYGWNITNVLLGSMIGAAACYLIAGFSGSAALAMPACILTGLFTSLLWPGTLILMEEKIPGVGVTAYALMAAGGDFGASVAPQTMGAVVDMVAAGEWGIRTAEALSITPEQFGIKVGMLIASLFPLLGVGLLLFIKWYFKKQKSL